MTCSGLQMRHANPFRVVAFLVGFVHWTVANFTNSDCRVLWDRKVARFTQLRDLHRQVKCDESRGVRHPPSFEAGLSSSFGCGPQPLNFVPERGPGTGGGGDSTPLPSQSLTGGCGILERIFPPHSSRLVLPKKGGCRWWCGGGIGGGGGLRGCLLSHPGLLVI